MMLTRFLSTRRATCLPALAALASLLVSAAPVSPPARSGRPALFKDSRQTLAIARAQGRKEIMVLLAAKPGQTDAVAKRAKALGADIRYRDDEVGYLRVRVPLDAATKTAELEGVQAATLDYEDTFPNRLTPGTSGRPTPSEQPRADQQPPDPAKSAVPPAAQELPEWPPHLSEYPLLHPYSPLHDLVADEMRKQHPTWDGRGVTIALLDGNLDMLLPEFQTAYSIDGKPVPKIADYLNVTDPRDDADQNPQWVDMKTVVTSSGKKVSYGGKTFTVGKDGTYRIGFFSERKFDNEDNAAYIDQDIDRDGNPKGDDGLFGVLWDEKTNDVWVDTNRNLDFSDEKAMTDYARRSEFGVFGKDDPSTPFRETVGFAVQTDKKNKFVSINVGIYQHATTIMGSVVGNREPKGRLQGVAPGARLVSMFYGVSNEHGLIEGLIAAFRHPQVDIVVLEQSVAIASIPYLLADATHPISVIAQRLIDRYKKLVFVPGDNAPAFGFVAEDGLAPGAVSVGGYQSKESYRVNNGIVPEREDNLHWGALSHGPAGDGALKPDLLAPSGQMGTEVGYRKGAGQKGLYQLPPGYSVDGGTSTATPMAAGATALVVSAAKQTGVPWDAVHLKAAITGSTRYISTLGAHEQGNGLIQVGPAYELLKKLQGKRPLEIAVRAPVHTKLSRLLETPDEGVGIYEREGWSTGQTGERTVTFTRTSGPAGPMKFSVSWQGNDGTFSSASSVDLPLGSPVRFPVAIAPKKEGPHTAILTLDNADAPGHVRRMLATVVVPYRFTSANDWSITAEITPPAPGDAPVFVDVPPGTEVVRVSASNPAVLLSMIGPDKDAVYPCPFSLEPTGPPVCALARPQPGVWEINVANNMVARRFDPDATALKAAPVTVTATALAVDLALSPKSLAAPGPGRSQAFQVEAKNRLGKIAAAASSVDLGSVRRARGSIAQGEQRVYEIVVPKGASSLRARVSGVADSGADLDVYLLDCTSPEKSGNEAAEKEKEKEKKELEKGNKSPMRPAPLCGPVAKAADVGSGGEVGTLNPKPGRWVVVVDAFSAPHGPTDYEYLDIFTAPRFGSLASADLPEDRAPAAAWTAPSNAWTATLPEPPRVLGGVAIVTSKDVTMGSGRFGQGDKVPVPIGWTDLLFDGKGSAPGGSK